jgi:hypothetical protein
LVLVDPVVAVAASVAGIGEAIGEAGGDCGGDEPGEIGVGGARAESCSITARDGSATGLLALQPFTDLANLVAFAAFVLVPGAGFAPGACTFAGLAVAVAAAAGAGAALDGIWNWVWLNMA